MSRTWNDPRTILSTADADVAQGSATWYDVTGCDAICLLATITGTVTIKIDLDVSNNATGLTTATDMTATGVQTITTPVRRVRAYTTGCTAGESASLKLIDVYNNV